MRAADKLSIWGGAGRLRELPTGFLEASQQKLQECLIDSATARGDGPVGYRVATDNRCGVTRLSSLPKKCSVQGWALQVGGAPRHSAPLIAPPLTILANGRKDG